MNYLEIPKIARLTSEIHWFNDQGIKVSIEIGKRLEEAKSEFPDHEQWLSWAETEFGYKKSQAYKLVAIAKRFHSSGIPIEGKTINELYALTVFDDNELQEPKRLSDGTEKKLMDMTNKEIEQYKRAKAEAERRAKEAEERAAKAENEARHWQNVAKSAQNQPPRIITNTVEKIPDHIKKKIEEDEIKLRTLKAGLEEAQREIERLRLQDTVEFDELQSQLQRKKLQHEADMETLQLSIVYKQFIEKAAIGSYQLGALAMADPTEKKRLLERIEIAQKILDDTKSALQGRKLGGVINE